jgi:glycerophosphoryl diester phosphodiesterase
VRKRVLACEKLSFRSRKLEMREFGICLTIVALSGLGCTQFTGGGHKEGCSVSCLAAKGPAIVAHRGLHHTLPENSKEAMLAAWNSGIQWCECDVYLSADGVVVLMHDAKLDRTTEAKGPITERTWAELKQIRLKNPDGTLSECRIPSLEEVLAVMPKGCSMLIEIKTSDNEPLVRETLRLAKGRSCIIQSFDEANVRYAMRLGNLPVAFLASKPEKIEVALAGEWKAINIDFKRIDEQLVERAKAAGKALGAWTVNEPADIQRMLDLGMDPIITDQPERVREMAAARAQ